MPASYIYMYGGLCCIGLWCQSISYAYHADRDPEDVNCRPIYISGLCLRGLCNKINNKPLDIPSAYGDLQ